MRIVTHDQLVDAVRRGIITPAQYDALLAMEPADVSPHLGAGAGIAEVAALAEMGGAKEPPRGFNWITITYYLGAVTVMFAFGWFLVDRWKTLGAGGILAVTAVYAGLFIATGEYLRRLGYRVAGGLLTAAAVGMTPLIVWGLQNVLGVWAGPSPRGGPDPFDGPFDGFHVRQTLNWIVIEIATIVAALVAFRRLRFAFLLAPAAISFFFLPHHLVEAALGEGLGRRGEAWIMVATGTTLITIAYAIDRRDRERADYAYWPYLVGVFVAGFGIVELWDRYPPLRHLLPVVALLTVAASLTLRRVIFLAFGGVMLYAYLAWLSFELFRASALFPIVLATLGLGIIVGAVWFQRSYPRMVARVNAGLADPRPWLPAGYLTPVLVIAFSLVMKFLSLPSDRAYARSNAAAMRRFQEEAAQMEQRERQRAREPRPGTDPGSSGDTLTPRPPSR